ncbi:MAG: LysR family transcriptional regulator, partial [Aeromonas veronii]
MDLNAALILVRIVDKGSFTGAARELGMTKAMV